MNNNNITNAQQTNKILDFQKTNEKEIEKQEQVPNQPLSLPQVLEKVEHVFDLGGEPFTISLTTFFEGLSKELEGGFSFCSPLLPDLLSKESSLSIEMAKKSPILPPFHVIPKNQQKELPFLDSLAKSFWQKLSEKQKEAIQLPEKFKNLANESKEKQWPGYLRVVMLEERVENDSVRWRLGPYMIIFYNNAEKTFGQEVISFPLKTASTPTIEKKFILNGEKVEVNTVLQAAALETFFCWGMEGKTGEKIDQFLKKQKQKIPSEILSRAFPGWKNRDATFLLFFFIHFFSLRKDGTMFSEAKKWLVDDYFKEEWVEKSPFKVMFPLIQQVSLSNFRVILFFLTVFESYRGNGTFDLSTMRFQWNHEGKTAWLSFPYVLPSVAKKLGTWKEKEWKAFSQAFEPYLETYSINSKPQPMGWDVKQLGPFFNHKHPIAQAMGHFLFSMCQQEKNDSFVGLWSCLLSLCVKEKKPNLYGVLLKMAPKEAVKGFPTSGNGLELVLYYLSSNHPEKVRLAKTLFKELSEEQKEKVLEQILRQDPNEAFVFYLRREKLSVQQQWEAFHKIRKTVESQKKTLFPQTLSEGAKKLLEVSAPRKQKLSPEESSLVAWWAKKMILASLSEEVKEVLRTYEKDFSPEDKRELHYCELEMANGLRLNELTKKWIGENWFKESSLFWRKKIFVRYLGTLTNGIPKENDWPIIEEALSSDILEIDYLRPLLEKILRFERTLPENHLIPVLCQLIKETENSKRKDLLNTYFLMKNRIVLFGNVVANLSEDLVKECLEESRDLLRKLSDGDWAHLCESLLQKWPEQLCAVFPSLEKASLSRLTLYWKSFFPDRIDPQQLLFGTDILLHLDLSTKDKKNLSSQISNLVVNMCCQLSQRGHAKKAEELQKKYVLLLSSNQKNKIEFSALQAVVKKGSLEEIKEVAIQWAKKEEAFVQVLATADQTSKTVVLNAFLKSVSSDDTPTVEESIFLGLALEEKTVEPSLVFEFLLKNPTHLPSLPMEKVQPLIEEGLKDEVNIQKLLHQLLLEKSCFLLIEQILVNAPSPLKETLYEENVLSSSIGLEQKFSLAKVVYSSSKDQILPKGMADLLFLLGNQKESVSSFFTSERWKKKSLHETIHTFLFEFLKKQGKKNTLDLIATHPFLQIPFKETFLQEFDSFFEKGGKLDIQTLLVSVKMGLCRQPALWKMILEEKQGDQEMWALFWERIRKDPSLLKDPTEWGKVFLANACEMGWDSWSQVAELLTTNKKVPPELVKVFSKKTVWRLKQAKTSAITKNERTLLIQLSSTQKEQLLLQTTLEFLLQHPSKDHLLFLLHRLGQEHDQDRFEDWFTALNKISQQEREQVLQQGFQTIKSFVFFEGTVSPQLFTKFFVLLPEKLKNELLSLLTKKSQNDLDESEQSLLWKDLFKLCSSDIHCFFTATDSFFDIYEPLSFSELLSDWKDQTKELLDQNKEYVFGSKRLKSVISLLVYECDDNEMGEKSINTLLNLLARDQKKTGEAIETCFLEVLKRVQDETIFDIPMLKKRLDALEFLLNFFQNYSKKPIKEKIALVNETISTFFDLAFVYQEGEETFFEKITEVFLIVEPHILASEAFQMKVKKLLKNSQNLTEGDIERISLLQEVLQKKEKLPPCHHLTTEDQAQLLELLFEKLRITKQEKPYIFLLEIVELYAPQIFKNAKQGSLIAFLKKAILDLSTHYFFESDVKALLEPINVENQFNLPKNLGVMWVPFDKQNPQKVVFYELAKMALFAKEVMKLLTEEEKKQLQWAFIQYLVKGNRENEAPVTVHLGCFTMNQFFQYLNLQGKTEDLDAFYDVDFDFLCRRYCFEVVSSFVKENSPNSNFLPSFQKDITEILNLIDKISPEIGGKYAYAFVKNYFQAFIDLKLLISKNASLSVELLQVFYLIVKDCRDRLKPSGEKKFIDLLFIKSLAEIIQGAEIPMKHQFGLIAFDHFQQYLQLPGQSIDLKKFYDDHGLHFTLRFCMEKVSMFVSLYSEDENNLPYFEGFGKRLLKFLEGIEKAAPSLVDDYAFLVLNALLESRILLKGEEQQKRCMKPILKELVSLLHDCKMKGWLKSINEEKRKKFEVELKVLLKTYAPDLS